MGEFPCGRTHKAAVEVVQAAVQELRQAVQELQREPLPQAVAQVEPREAEEGEGVRTTIPRRRRRTLVALESRCRFCP